MARKLKDPALCLHENFDDRVVVYRMAGEDPLRYALDLRVECKECGTPFRFERVSVDPTGTTLGAAIKPGAAPFAVQTRREVG